MPNIEDGEDRLVVADGIGTAGRGIDVAGSDSIAVAVRRGSDEAAVGVAKNVRR